MPPIHTWFNCGKSSCMMAKCNVSLEPGSIIRRMAWRTCLTRSVDSLGELEVLHRESYSDTVVEG
jgi:hypothetical protein